jgi:hypothetical protein
MNLNDKVKVTRVVNATAAGTTDINGTAVDMVGFESVMFVGMLGALTATQVTKIKVQQGSASDGSDGADLAGSSTGPLADGDGNKCLMVEIVRPTKRYVRPVVDRGTANAVIDGVIAIQRGATNMPTTHDANIVAQKVLISPAEGTA